MLKAIPRRLPLMLATLLIAGTSASAQDPNEWARKMFDEYRESESKGAPTLGHDFGFVARGTEVNHRFKLTNLYKEDVRIANVTTTCGCTAPKFNQAPLKSLQSTYIDISMDTNKFKGEKISKVTIHFDQPQFADVEFSVKVYIRSDIVVTPSSVNFGNVDQGVAQERTLSLTYAYDNFAGHADWEIPRIDTNNKFIKAKAVEKARGNGQVLYDLIVSLQPDAPIGDLRQQISLATNDANNPQIPLLVQARVEPDVTVTPAVVQLGMLSPGNEAVKTVMLRGRKPFVVQKVECESARQAFKMTQLPKDPKAFHVLSLNFTAPKETGTFVEKFIVTVEGRPEPIVFTARGTIETAQCAEEQAGK